MPSYFMRLEGVNLDSFVFDTSDLSTIRGGGLLLLDAVREVEKHFNLHHVSTGASVGLFQVDSDDPLKQAADVVAYLGNHEHFRHATFVVDVERDQADSFVLSRERVLARNRWRQQRQPTVSVAELFVGIAQRACAKDLVRPGIEKVINPENHEELQSISVYARREHGRDEKRKLYRRLTHLGVATSNEFESLAAPPKRSGPWTTPLYYKMAVIYADGNNFGKKQAEHCKTAKLLKHWDDALQTSRTALLTELVNQARTDPAWHENESLDDPIRLETLLWGGDELIWVVPAWKGFETLELFFKQTNTWELPDELSSAGPLTHAAGIVFCSFKSPIKRVTDLAKNLAEVAKKKSRDADGFAVEFLESFDHVGSAEDALRRRGPKGGDIDNLVFKGADLSGLIGGIREIKSPRVDFPRRKLHEVVEGATGGTPNEAVEQLLEDHLERRLPGKWSLLKEQLGGQAVWCNLWAWWDYVPNPDDFPKEVSR